MKYTLWFSIAAEVLLGCVVFAALFASPLVASEKVLVGAFVLLFAVVADRASTSADEQRSMVEILLTNQQAQAAISNSSALVIFRLAKYSAWVGCGWIIGKLIA